MSYTWKYRQTNDRSEMNGNCEVYIYANINTIRFSFLLNFSSIIYKRNKLATSSLNKIEWS